MKNLYSILEISSNASEQAIKSAYRKLVKQWHPDRHEGSISAQNWFIEIREAYETLSDKDKKKAYDIRFKKAKMFRRVVQLTKPKIKMISEEPRLLTFEELQQKLAQLTKEHQLHVQDAQKTAQYYRDKKEKAKTFYDTFRENREQAYQAMRG